MKTKIFALLLLGFTACASVQQTSNIEKNMVKQEISFLNKKDLVGKEFVIDNKNFETRITLGFTKDRIYGFSGVNRYFALYKIKNNRLIVDNIGTTMMAGPDADMIEEVKFIDFIGDNKKMELSGNTLTLFSNEGIKIKFNNIKTKNNY